MKILIADDEEMARVRLQRMLTALRPEAELLEAATGRQALDCVSAQSPTIAILDIRMPGMDGLEAARHISLLRNSPWIIFTTAWQQHAMEAFDCHAVDYLLKPVTRQALKQALWRAESLDRARLAQLHQSMGSTRRFLSVRIGRRLELVPIEEVLYLRAEHKYTLLGQSGGEKVLDETLRSLEQEFADSFLRVHRRALAATRHIKGLERSDNGWEVLLHGSPVRLAVSRRLLSQVRAHLQL